MLFINNTDNSRIERYKAMKQLKSIQDKIEGYEVQVNRKKLEKDLASTIKNVPAFKLNAKETYDSLFLILENPSYSLSDRIQVLNLLIESNNIDIYNRLFIDFTKYQYWSSEPNGESDIYIIYNPLKSKIKKQDYQYLNPIINGLGNIDTKKSKTLEYPVILLGDLLVKIIGCDDTGNTLINQFIEIHKNSNPITYNNLNLIKEQYFIHYNVQENVDSLINLVQRNDIEYPTKMKWISRLAASNDDKALNFLAQNLDTYYFHPSEVIGEEQIFDYYYCFYVLSQKKNKWDILPYLINSLKSTQDEMHNFLAAQLLSKMTDYKYPLINTILDSYSEEMNAEIYNANIETIKNYLK